MHSTRWKMRYQGISQQNPAFIPPYLFMDKIKRFLFKGSQEKNSFTTFHAVKRTAWFFLCGQYVQSIFHSYKIIFDPDFQLKAQKSGYFSKM